MSHSYYRAFLGLFYFGLMPPAPLPSVKRRGVFYTGLALALAGTVLVGFSRTYYLKALYATPALSWLAHLHGAVFTAWTAFFVVQVALVACGRTDIHSRLGWPGLAFAAAVVCLGAAMTLHSVRAGYASRRPGMPELLISAIIDLVLFCSFFGAGVLLRRNKEAHKRMMVLAMICLIIPAIGRVPMPFTMIKWVILAFSVTGLIYDAVVLRRVYASNVIGVIVINVATPLHFMIADARPWQVFSEWIGR